MYHINVRIHTCTNTYVYIRIRTLQKENRTHLIMTVERVGGATTQHLPFLNSELNPDFSIIIFNLLPSFLNHQ